MRIMNVATLAQVASSEEASEEFFRTKGVLKTFDAFLFSGSFPPGKVRRPRYKCYRYEREWSVRRESLLEGLRIPLSKFVFALKLSLRGFRQ
jgi:transposase